MKSEAELCTILKNSFLEEGEFAYKIPDPSGLYSQTIQRPYDLIASWKGAPIFLEAKFQKGLKSFDLQRIEDHQIETLKMCKDRFKGAKGCIALGVNVERGDNRVYLFLDIEEIAERRREKRNYHKKELEELPYLSVHKNLVDLKSTNL